MDLNVCDPTKESLAFSSLVRFNGLEFIFWWNKVNTNIFHLLKEDKEKEKGLQSGEDAEKNGGCNFYTCTGKRRS